MKIFPLLLCVASCADDRPVALPEPSSDTRVELKSGLVIGFKSENGANVWRGLPYAAPPVGELRWRAPKNVASWSTEKIAVDQPNWCPQITTALDELYGIEAGQLMGNEDCLYLSVYAPKNYKKNTEIPVMFWVHGGSNVWGRAEEYDGSILAERYGVVVVVVQYRLGPLGFFTHSSLRNSAKDPLDKSANFAVLDLIQALKWVQDNIQEFGGNPNEVTIFGESAGALNVYALTVSSLSKNLFHRAIVQSGNPKSTPLDWAEQGHTGISNSFNDVAVEMTNNDNPNAEDLRNLSISDVFAPYFGENGRENMPTMLNDGITIPQDGIYANLADSLKERNIPLILGSNKDEAKYLLAFNPQFTKKRFGLILTAKDKAYYDAMSEYLSGVWRATTVNEPVQALISANVDNIYSYRFDWDNQGSFWASDVSYLIGASHMVEIPFVFGTFNSFLGKFGQMMFNEDNRTERELLSSEMMAYWSNFAHTGKPGIGKNGKKWPKMSFQNSLQTFKLDALTTPETAMVEEKTTVEGLISSLRTDPRLEEEGRRCIVATTLEQIFGLTNEKFSPLKEDVCASQ